MQKQQTSTRSFLDPKPIPTSLTSQVLFANNSIPYHSAFLQHIRTFTLRMQSLCQQSTKFNLNHPLQQMDVLYSRLLHLNSKEINQSTIYQLTNVGDNNKSDQYVLLVMTLLYDLAKSTVQIVGDWLAVNKWGSQGRCGVADSMVQCIIQQSLAMIKQQKKHQSLISKQNQLLRIILQLIPIYLPVAILNQASSSNSYRNSGVSLLQFLFSTYKQLLLSILHPKQQISQSTRQQIRKNGSKYIEASIKGLGGVLSFVMIQTPNKLQAEHNNHIKTLIRITSQIMKYTNQIFKNIINNIYKLIQMLNNIVLSSPSSPNSMPSIPQSSTIYPQVSTIYNNNINQILFSRLKTLKLIIQLITIIHHMELCQSYHCWEQQQQQQQQEEQQKQQQFVQGDYGNLRVFSDIGQEDRAILRNMFYCEDVLHKSVHAILQVNWYVKMSNYYVFGLLITLYQKIMPLLLHKKSLVPLYLYTHIIINNLKQLTCSTKPNQQKPPSSPTTPTPQKHSSQLPLIPSLHLHPYSYALSMYTSSISTSISTSTSTLTSTSLSNVINQFPSFSQLLLYQILLDQVANLFMGSQLVYFLKVYDWNFMEEDICLNSIKLLYQFIQNNENQKKQQYEIFKKCLTIINKHIQNFLQHNPSPTPSPSMSPLSPISSTISRKQRKQFYELKHKQYLQIVQKINKKPKDIFKIIQEFNKNGEKDKKQDYIQKCIRIVKRSNHIQQRALIDFMAANCEESKEILGKYLQGFFKGKTGDASLEHFLRYIISNFFLNGQSQQIQRFIDILSTQFYTHQPQKLFKSANVAYIFANAIILLNADQHNPKNPNRMPLQSFIKMCDKINQGESLPVQVIKQTYKNIRESQIHTFRNRYGMQKISLQCWLDIVNQYQCVGIQYYDQDMLDVCNNDNSIRHADGFREFANQLLLSVIDQKQTQKLEGMIERFQYDDRKFDCQIIDKIRVMIANKKHMAMHALQKIYEVADFKNKKIDQKMVSYCWLASGIIDNFYDSISFNKVSEYLLKTWRIGFELKDNLIIRQNAQLKSIKKCLKEHKKKESKKSIMDIFSKFLSAKDSQDSESHRESESPLIAQSSSKKKMPNITNASFKTFQHLMSSNTSRARAAQNILLSLRHEQSRRYQQFVSCLYLIFHLINGQDKQNQATNIQDIQTPLKNYDCLDNQQDGVTQQCAKIMFNLLEDFYCISQQHLIGSRIAGLKTKNVDKYQLIYTYAQFWTLKLIFKWSVYRYCIGKKQQPNGDQSIKEQQERIQKIYKNCVTFVSKANSQLLDQLLSIIDIKDMSFKIMLQNLKIPQQILNALRIGIENTQIKLKNIRSTELTEDKKLEKSEDKNKQQLNSKMPITRSKSQPNISKEEQNDQQMEKYIRELQRSTVKSEDTSKYVDKNESIGEDGKIVRDIQEQMKRQLGIADTHQTEQAQHQTTLPSQEPSTQKQNKEQKKQDQTNRNKEIEDKEHQRQKQKQHTEKQQNQSSKQNQIENKKINEEQSQVRKQNIQQQQQKQKQKQREGQQKDEKKSNVSNQSGEDIGLPIYML